MRSSNVMDEAINLGRNQNDFRFNVASLFSIPAEPISRRQHLMNSFADCVKWEIEREQNEQD